MRQAPIKLLGERESETRVRWVLAAILVELMGKNPSFVNINFSLLFPTSVLSSCTPGTIWAPWRTRHLWRRPGWRGEEEPGTKSPQVALAGRTTSSLLPSTPPPPPPQPAFKSVEAFSLSFFLWLLPCAEMVSTFILIGVLSYQKVLLYCGGQRWTRFIQACLA